MSKVKTVLFGAVAISIFIYCSAAKKSSSIIAVKFSWRSEFFDKERDKIFLLEGSNKIYYYEDMLLYQKEDTFIGPDNKEIPQFTYWMSNNSKKTGIKYNTLLEYQKGITFSADSFLRQNALKDAVLYNVVSDSIVKRVYSKSRNTFIVATVPKKKNDESYPDSTLFYFDKSLMELPFMLASNLEAASKAKLVKVEGIYNPMPHSKYTAQRKRRTMVWSMEKTIVDDPNRVMNFFQKFKEAAGKLN